MQKFKKNIEKSLQIFGKSLYNCVKFQENLIQQYLNKIILLKLQKFEKILKILLQKFEKILKIYCENLEKIFNCVKYQKHLI